MDKGTREFYADNLKVIIGNEEGEEPFVGIYFANGNGFEQIAVYVDRNGCLVVEKDEDTRTVFLTDDGYTIKRKKVSENNYLWTDGDLEFKENEHGHPIDDSGDELFGIFLNLHKDIK